MFSIAVGSAIASGLSTALLEYVLTLKRTHPVWANDTPSLLLLLIALYGPVALGVGLVEGVIASGLVAADVLDELTVRLRRLSSDEGFDRAVAGTLLAACASGVAFAWWVAQLGFALVAHSHRQLVGAVITGALAAASLPLFILAAFPVQRLTRLFVRALPRARRLPATVILTVAILAAITTAGALYVETKLDWREMKLGAFIGGALFFGLQAFWLLVLLGPLARVRALVRARWPIFAVALAATLILPPLVLRGTQRPGTIALLYQASYGGGSITTFVQRLFDRDHDGYSTLLGGGDCDDHDPSIHPGAPDWPDDGIDQNCLGGDAHAHPPPPPAAPVEGAFHFRGNLIVLFIDTLRADALDADHMPNLDALAQSGVRFRRAYAQAPGTSRSYPSMVTSRLPSRIHWDEPKNDFPGMLLSNHTLFEALHDAGYHTVGVASHWYFDTNGLQQGFDEFDNSGVLDPEEEGHDVSSPRLLARIERMLPRLIAGEKPFAMLVHLTEPHAAYEPHPEVRHGGPVPATRRDQYAEEVQFLDGQLGRLFQMLADQKIAERTMIVAFSDHGEAFGRHREEGRDIFRHGQTLYDDVLRVPMVIRAPGMKPHAVIEPVMLMDLAPTLLDVVGAPIPSSFQGRSLAGALAGLPLPPAPVYSELLAHRDWSFDARALLDADGRTKVIYRLTHPRFEIYDVLSDPFEARDLSALKPEVTDRMRRQIADWLDSAP